MKKPFSTGLQYAWLLSFLCFLACSKQKVNDQITPGELNSNIAAAVAVSIVNPGFEQDKTGWGDPNLFAISTSDFHSGAKSAKLTASGNRITQNVTVVSNTNYVLTAWILGKGTIGAKSGSTVLSSQGSCTDLTMPVKEGSTTFHWWKEPELRQRFPPRLRRSPHPPAGQALLM